MILYLRGRDGLRIVPPLGPIDPIMLVIPDPPSSEAPSRHFRIRAARVDLAAVATRGNG